MYLKKKLISKIKKLDLKKTLTNKKIYFIFYKGILKISKKYNYNIYINNYKNKLYNFNILFSKKNNNILKIF